MRIFVFITLLLLFAGCIRSTAPEDVGMTIQHAEENAFARYYSGIEIKGEFVYYRLSRFGGVASEDVAVLSDADRADIWQLVNKPVLERLADSLRCNVCAVDGSSESIIIETGNETITINMDANLEVVEIDGLLEKLREIRKQFEAEIE